MKSIAITKPVRSKHKPTGLKTKFHQLGGMMIESLIGLLILSVVGGGVMHATARMNNTQQQQVVNNITVNQMRALLMNRASATGADLCTGTHSLTVPGKSEPVALSVKGCGNTDFTIKNVKVDTATLPDQTIASIRPVVLEAGADANMIRVGGAEVTSGAAH